jgi:Skp family chaperone for outer membrane proteins
MKSLSVLVLFAVTTIGCGTRVGYIDPQSAIQQTEEWRQVEASVTAYSASQQPAIDAAKDAVTKARTAKDPGDEIVAKENKYGDLVNALNAEVKRREDAGGSKILDGMRKLIEPMAAADGLGAVVPRAGAVWIDPKLDLTEKLAKKYDAQAAAASVGEVQQLRQEVADLKAAKQGSPPLAKK